MNEKMRKKSPIPLLAGLFLGALVLVTSAGAGATIILPDDAMQRDEVLDDLREICPDVELSAMMVDGQWVLVKEEPANGGGDDGTDGGGGDDAADAGGHSVGCELVCRLVDADCNVEIEVDPTHLAGHATPDDPDNAQNGTGSDSTVTYNPNPSVYYFDADGNKHPATGPAVLGHELCHSEEMWLGLIDPATAEENAIELWENPIHRQHGETEREGHGGTTDPC